MKRDIGQELLEGIRAIKAGEGRRVQMAIPDPRTVREKAMLTQSAFAGLLGVSVRTVQDWEQGRRVPCGPAVSLLKIANQNPEALKAIA
ncbi:MAG: helix-turn-helix domain-containing protein [Magnetococcales bacterium]|nr:helix-turn-helix domain-containing protein [Magnetococcales bacterium]